MTTVLAAVVADECARPVLRTAVALADLIDATPVALNVREPGVASPSAVVRAAGMQLREVSGSPVEAIVAAADDGAVAALVLGTRGTADGRQPAGHTALKVITEVGKPVAVAPPATVLPPTRVGRLLVPLDGTLASSHALEDAIALAHSRQLDIVVLHVHSPATVPAFSDHEPYGTHAWNEEFLDRQLEIPHDRVRLLRRLGVAAEDIVRTARDTSCDLVVLAWSQDVGGGHAKVVSETIAHTSVPILLLPVLARASSRRR